MYAVVTSDVASVKFGVHQGAVPTVGGQLLVASEDDVGAVVVDSVGGTEEEVASDQDPSSVDGGTHQLTIADVDSTTASVRFGVHQGAVPTVGGHTNVVDSVNSVASVDTVI